MWYKFLQQEISVVWEEYITSLNAYEEEIRHILMEQYEQKKDFQFNPEQLQQLLIDVQYPNIQNIFDAINNQNIEQLKNEYKNFFEWYIQSTELVSDVNLFNKARQIRFILESLSDDNAGLNIEQINEYIKQIKQQAIENTQKNVNIVSQKIQSSISQAKWNGSQVVIEISPIDKDTDYDTIPQGQDAFSINVGRGKYATPYFTLWLEGEQFIVEDVLEGGDTDYFTSDKLQEDYFSLVGQLKDKEDKEIMLYTARPVKDRESIMENNALPPNTFLTSSFDRAQGIASDLAGDEKERDVWKVKINTQHLNQTLDSPFAKGYQIISSEWVPVRQLRLISEGR